MPILKQHAKNYMELIIIYNQTKYSTQEEKHTKQMRRHLTLCQSSLYIFMLYFIMRI